MEIDIYLYRDGDWNHWVTGYLANDVKKQLIKEFLLQWMGKFLSLSVYNKSHQVHGTQKNTRQI